MVDTKVTTLAQQKQLDLYEIKRVSLFKGTIAVCAVYGTIALIILLITIFTEFGKTVLADTMFAFTTTFIAGMILIVVILGISVSMYKMPDTDFSTYNTLSCPDYYTLEKEAVSNLGSYNTGIKNKMTYKCVADTNVWGTGFGTSTTASVSGGIMTYNNSAGIGTTSFTGIGSTTSFYKYMDGIGLGSTSGGVTTYTGIGTTNQQCNNVFPLYLSSLENESDPTKLHCQWSKVCGVPWSSACTTPPSGVNNP